eukprot:TRINITY_DN11416_c4_g12_i1.p1 TRINITY_DN11416_c4_g12~~TRINITY_DN11416_c4_g12_i1.p1  ORF type:complete len:140 (-),score=12.48 TRINITY_DN11416_c4_g12_i1:1588-2007(-)
MAGSTNWRVMSSKTKPEPSELLWEPHVVAFFKDIPIRDVAVGACASTIYFVTKSGHLFSIGVPGTIPQPIHMHTNVCLTGRNDQGQLGVGDLGDDATSPLLVTGLAEHKYVIRTGTRTHACMHLETLGLHIEGSPPDFL